MANITDVHSNEVLTIQVLDLSPTKESFNTCVSLLPRKGKCAP